MFLNILQATPNREPVNTCCLWNVFLYSVLFLLCGAPGFVVADDGVVYPKQSSCGEDVLSSASTADTRGYMRTGDFPGSILLPDSDVSFKIGGYTKLDFIYDFDAIGSTDNFDTLTIATSGVRTRNVRMHARQSRLNLDARSPTGDIRLFLEGDFFGIENALRLRHSYVTVGPLLAGQTWSTFIDETILPDLVDFESPSGVTLTRRAVLRWTQPLNVLDGLEYSVAVEDPTPAFSSPTGEFESELPDFIGRLRFEQDRWHLQASGFMTKGSFTPTVGAASDDVAWGFNMTGRVTLRDSDRIEYQIAWGEGAERFRGLQSYSLAPSGALFAVPGFAWYFAYEHQWNDELKSVVAFSRATVDNLPGMPTAIRSTEYLAANLLWTPIDRVRLGVDYLFGTREDQDRSHGSAHRIQFAVWYYLP